jgi:hypothetical protein
VSWHYERDSFVFDSYWKNEVSYIELIYDYLEIGEDKVTFKYEEYDSGHSETIEIEYSFDEFMYKYYMDTLKK